MLSYNKLSFYFLKFGEFPCWELLFFIGGAMGSKKDKRLEGICLELGRTFQDEVSFGYAIPNKIICDCSTVKSKKYMDSYTKTSPFSESVEWEVKYIGKIKLA